MGIEFDCPVGLKADESELLYISALHQTGGKDFILRRDASISAEDIRCYLISRYGIVTSTEMVESMVLNNSSSLDLISLVGILFVPTFMKLATPIEELGDVETTICPKLLERVLDMIMYDVTGDSERKVLTISLLRDIFQKYGEDAVASDDEQLEQILQAATGGKEGVFLNEKSLLRALTQDLHSLNVRQEVEVSTNFNDVFGDDCYECNGIKVSTENDAGEVVGGRMIKRLNTGKAIDFIAGTYSCKYQVICVWAFFGFTFMGYVYSLVGEIGKGVHGYCSTSDYVFLSTWAANAVPFRCSIATSILEWLLLFTAIVLTGFVVVWFGSVGYESEPTGSAVRRGITRLFSILLLLFTLLAGPLLIGGFEPGQDPGFIFLRCAAFVLGCVTIILRILREIHYLTKYDGLTSGTAVVHEQQIKRASALKIKNMQQHSLELTYSPISEKSVVRSYYGQALSNYTKHEDRLEPIGNFVWFSKRYWNGDIYTCDGLWFSARFLGSIFTTLILAMFILVTGIYLIRYTNSNWIPQAELDMQIMNRIESILEATADISLVKSAVNELMDQVLSFLLSILSFFDGAGILRLDCFLLGKFLTDLCENQFNSTFSDTACNLFLDTENICDALDQLYRPQDPFFSVNENTPIDYFTDTDFALNTTILREPFVNIVSKAARNNVLDQVNKLYPKERYMVVAPVVVGCIAAIIASFSLTVVLLPSITSTTLKLRSGVIPTFTDPSFTDYRYEMNSITYISGCLFWGNLVASVLVGSLIGGFAFLCVWQVTIIWIQRLFALLIGVGLVVVVRGLLSSFCRTTFYRGFYRIRPLTANAIALLNSCLNFGISTATVIIRMAKLILLASLYVGRIDTPFVADKVGDFFNSWVKFEGYNRWFVADLLAVEAHRHPYIETLGKLYLMKLKHGSKFMCSTGGKWRELFVVAMMPWLHKYRKRAREINRIHIPANESNELDCI